MKRGRADESHDRYHDYVHQMKHPIASMNLNGARNRYTKMVTCIMIWMYSHFPVLERSSKDMTSSKL